MIRRLVTVFIAAGLAVASMAPMASAGVDRFEVPITGDSFDCDGTIYTVTDGSLKVKVHENESASGNTNLTVTIKPRATLSDGAGNEFKLVGAESVHVSTNANSGGMVVHERFHVVIVSIGGGGAVGHVSDVFHLTITPNGVHEVNISRGSCEGPIS